MHAFTKKDDGASAPEADAVPLTRRPSLLTLERLEGMVTGLALGDSLGLPVETLTAEEIRSQFGEVRTFLDPLINKYMAKYQPERGACSDDAQLSQALFEAYIIAGGFSLQAIADRHVAAYKTSTLGWGSGTTRGVKLILKGLTPGTPEFTSSLTAATGNGIPMKVAAMAAWAVAHDQSIHELAQQVQQLCSLSHPTTMSVSAGLAHIAALQYCLSIEPQDFSKAEFISRVVVASEIGKGFYPETQTQDDITARLKTLGEVAARGAEAIIEEYNGGGCYVYQSLPFALAFFLTGPDDPETIYRVIEAGGDTDSNGAMVGALQGALHGPALYAPSLVSQVGGLPELLRTAQRFFDRAQRASTSE